MHTSGISELPQPSRTRPSQARLMVASNAHTCACSGMCSLSFSFFLHLPMRSHARLPAHSLPQQLRRATCSPAFILSSMSDHTREYALSKLASCKGKDPTHAGVRTQQASTCTGLHQSSPQGLCLRAQPRSRARATSALELHKVQRTPMSPAPMSPRHRQWQSLAVPSQNNVTS